MKTQKKHTQKQQIARLAQENQRLFGLLIQLSNEIQGIGMMSETTLQVLKKMPNYDECVEAFKAEREAADAKASTQETSIAADLPETRDSGLDTADLILD